MKLDILVWKIIGSASSIGLIVGAIYSIGVNNTNHQYKNNEIINTLNNTVIPAIHQLHVADSIQTVNIIDIKKSMVTKDVLKDVEVNVSDLIENQNVILKYNSRALDEIKKNREIDELTQRKADAYDDIKKKEVLNVIVSDIK